MKYQWDIGQTEREPEFTLEPMAGGWQPGEYYAPPGAGDPYYTGEWPEPTPKAPPAPPWLSKFLPELEAGKEIRKLPMTLPSAQIAGRITPKQWAGLESYLKWTPKVKGQPESVSDVFRRMEQMLPSRQATRPRWGTRR